jgi:hypothetical protein
MKQNLNRAIVWSDESFALPTGISKFTRSFWLATGGAVLAAGAFLLSASGMIAGPVTNTAAPAPLSCKADWRWVKGAVFVPTKYVNEAQQWDEYDPVINDRELHYASIYGINCVRVYLHFDIYLKKKEALLKNIEDFLGRGEKYGIRTEFVFLMIAGISPIKTSFRPIINIPRLFLACITAAGLFHPGKTCASITRHTGIASNLMFRTSSTRTRTTIGLLSGRPVTNPTNRRKPGNC